MKRLIALALMACASLAQADNFRCGSSLVGLGDRAFEVESKCGAPQQRDLVGYSLGEYDRREFKVEEWVYGPNNGFITILTFEGNRLRQIERKRSR